MQSQDEPGLIAQSLDGDHSAYAELITSTSNAELLRITNFYLSDVDIYLGYAVR